MDEEKKEEQSQTKFTIECVDCQKMFGCKGMPMDVDRCLQFLKRKDK